MQEAPELTQRGRSRVGGLAGQRGGPPRTRRELRGELAAARLGGGEKARARHTARGKLLPRDRVDALLDPGSPFLELSPLAADGMYDGEAPAAGIITGDRPRRRPRVRDRRQRRHRQGRHVLPDHGQEAPARAGGRPRRTGCRASTSSTPAARSCPCRTRSSPTASTSGGSSTTRPRCRRAASRRSPPCSARAPRAARTCPAMSDEAVIVRNQGTIFLGGPPLVKAATGEVVTAEELGGGDLHARVSGVTDHLAEDDAHALQIVRDIVATLARARAAPWEVAAAEEPAVDPRRALRRRAGRLPDPVRRARGHRPGRRRQPLPGVQGRVRRRRWSPASPASTATRSASSPTTASCSPSPP